MSYLNKKSAVAKYEMVKQFGKRFTLRRLLNFCSNALERPVYPTLSMFYFIELCHDSRQKKMISKYIGDLFPHNNYINLPKLRQ